MATKAKGQRRSVGLDVLLRLSGGFLKICLNVIIYAVIIFLIYKGAHFCYDFAYRVFGDVTMESGEGRVVKIQVLKGESTMNVAAKLETNKLIDNKYAFFVKCKLYKVDIIPGTKTLNTNMNYDELMEKLMVSENLAEIEQTVEEVESAP